VQLQILINNFSLSM